MRYNLSNKEREKFFDRIVKCTEGCWHWIGVKDTCGYGRLYLLRNGKYKAIGAHRISYDLYKGPIKRGLEIMHSCDIPDCVNPKHLRMGTHKQNMHDMFSKGRRQNLIGIKNPKAKLTNEQVMSIRREYVPKYGNLTKIAKKYNMSISGMWSVVNNKLWRSL